MRRLKQLAQIDTFFNEQLAYFIDQLKAETEGNGTLFDNIAIFVLRGQSRRTHSKENLPFFLAGSAEPSKPVISRQLGGVAHNTLSSP